MDLLPDSDPDAPLDVKPTRRKWPWFLGGGIALIVLLVVGAPFVYIHFIQADPLPALTFENNDPPTTTAPATSAPPPSSAANDAASAAPVGASTSASAAAASAPGTGSIDGNWTVTSGSQAGYRVK